MVADDPTRARQQQEREAERRRRAAIAEQKQQEINRKREYVAGRKAEAIRNNQAIENRVSELSSFLAAGLRRTVIFDANSKKHSAILPELQLGALGDADPEPLWRNFEPPTPNFWRRTFGNPEKLAKELVSAEQGFLQAQAAHRDRESQRLMRVAAARRAHEAELARIEASVARHNADLEAFFARVRSRSPRDVETFLAMVVDEIPTPSGFPRQCEVLFDQVNEDAILQLTLPGPEIIPTLKSLKYVQVRDEIVAAPRSLREKSVLYRRVVAQLVLLTARDLLIADPCLRRVSINGQVRHIKPSTGREERPHIISVVIDREQFELLVLERVQPEECLRYLGALVSPHPFELEPVRPLVEFEKSRIAFVEGRDAVSSLDSRPDLMAMSPTEFEHLVRQLLEADPSVLEVESLTTRQSNDAVSTESCISDARWAAA